MENIINKNNKLYKYLCVDDLITLKIMFRHFIYFYNSNDKHKIIGIDFEFYKVTKEKKNVSLIQINLENSTKNAFIFIFNPDKLTKKKLNIFIRFICSKRIIKIIHGGESLDIPYLFDNLFNKNNKLIKKFLKYMFDTKFLCEYIGYDKCNIYDLLYSSNVINNNTLDKLNQLNNDIGPIHKIVLDINSIKKNKDFEQYAINDVLYLPSLYNKMKIKLSNNINILQELTNINYFIKRNFDENFDLLYNNVNKINNYFVIDKNKNKIKLIDFYNYHVYYQNNNVLLQFNKVTYFSQFIESLIKCLLYDKIYNKYTIFKSNNIKYYEKINYQQFIFKYPYLNKIINKINFNFL